MCPPSLLAVLMTMQLASSYHQRSHNIRPFWILPHRMSPFFPRRVVLYSTAISRKLKQLHHVFGLDAIPLVLIHVTGYPPQFMNIPPTPIRVRQSKPPRPKQAVVHSWCEMMQASGLSSRLCCASFFRLSLSPSPLHRVTKIKWPCSPELRHISKTIVQLSFFVTPLPQLAW